jgi:hypothetical protein
MEVVALTPADCALLAARYRDHANSHRMMREALVRDGHEDEAQRLEALRNIERHFDLDLGLVCHLFDRRAATDCHPIEKMVIEFITEMHASVARDGAGDEVLWVLPDRVRQVRDLMQGHVVGERD